MTNHTSQSACQEPADLTELNCPVFRPEAASNNTPQKKNIQSSFSKYPKLARFEDRLFFLDGAMGTMLQKKGLKAGDIPEELNLTHPEILKEIYQEYANSGSNLVLANTFGANPLKLAKSSYTCEQIIESAIRNAKEALKETGKEDVLVALDVGPLGEMLEPLGTLPFESAYEHFKRMVLAGRKAGADLIFIETMTDLREAKAALLAAKENSDLPVFVTMTFEADGRSFMGVTLESMAKTLEGLGADAIGFNCSVGPDLLLDNLKKLTRLVSVPVIAKPNAGLPDPKDGSYSMKPDEFVSSTLEARKYGVRIFGGCCGTTPEFIAGLTRSLKDLPCVEVEKDTTCIVCSATKSIAFDQIRVIGERLNPTGKKRFQQALLEKDFDYILSIALEEVDAGADILDVNVGFPGVDEVEMLPLTVEKIQSVLDAPLQLDSSDPKALEAALRIYNGKPAVNSVNGKKEIQDAVFPLAAKYGAALVGLTIDEDGIPETKEKRVEIAGQILDAALSYGIAKEDLWIDPLTLTVSAQQLQARETLLALREITEVLGLHTVLGVSNISFGLPNRPLITQTFLIQALEEGLSAPIINPNSSLLMDAIASVKVLKAQDVNCIHYIETNAGRTSTGAASSKPAGKNENEASVSNLKEAVAKGLDLQASSLAKKLLESNSASELELVSEELIPALDLVGEKYEKKELYLPQLLSAAKAAQAVFDVIKDSLAQKGEESVKKGTIVLATVAGDVHDIGKNIVKTVLENYGYEIIDLGKDVPAEKIVQTVKEKNIQLVGLSALMTTTLPAMEQTVRLLKQLDNPPKVMVGGAVVTQEYSDSIQADYYCKDSNDDIKAAREVFGQ